MWLPKISSQDQKIVTHGDILYEPGISDGTVFGL